MNDNDLLKKYLNHFRNELRGKKIFLTGGTGFFGKWFQKSFLASDFDAELVILSRNPERFKMAFPEFDSPRINYIQGDIRNFVFPAGCFDYIIHAATEASAKLLTEKPQEMYEVCVTGTRHTLKFAKQASCKRFLFTSSGAVYGNQPPNLYGFPENYPCSPATAYGQGKYDAEQLCRESGLDVVLPRCFSFVGPYLNLDIHFAIGNFIRNGLDKEAIIIKGDGRPFRSYLYAADLMVWLWTILLRGKNGVPYNVGSPEALSIEKLAHTVAECFDSTIEVKTLGISDNSPASRYIPDATMAKTELGLEVLTPLKDAIKKSIKYISSNINYAH